MKTYALILVVSFVTVTYLGRELYLGVTFVTERIASHIAQPSR